MTGEDDLVKEFLVESLENLDRLDQDFLAIEKDTSATDRLGSIFRTIHTIKGTCGFLGFNKLESLTHAGESLLSRLRDGALKANVEITSALLGMVDEVRGILASIENTKGEGNGDYSATIQKLTKLKDGAPVEAVEVPTAKTPAAAAQEPPPAAEEDEHEEPAAAPVAVAADAGKPADTNSAAAGSGIRVDVGLLDRLMNLVGELVLARNQILQFTATTENPTLAASTQRLNLITSELQEGVMKTRMQPIGNIWNKFPRIVRDVAQMCGKNVRVEMEGRETELDKTIIEAIKDPLTHIIRNSVDHGIESPEKRRKAGKAEEGRLLLRAFHEGGQVNIEIIDDGAGINTDRVKAKAIERGLITAEQAARMGDREVVNLIFLPGFSTAEKLSNVSGRGVGMDVVKTNIERIGGTVDVQNKPGEGTVLRIKIPLTLAIIPALVITSGGDRFAIPQVSLLELVRLEPDQVKTGIENIRGTPVYRLRGNLLPLVYLNRVFRTQNDHKTDDGSVNIVIVQADERQFGLVVDEINDTEEIVVKPLGKLFKGMTTFAGATIMGDGRVALILDVLGLAQEANVLSDNKDRAMHDTAAQNKDAAAAKQTLLLFRISDTRRMAVPLSLVARLEEFPRSAIEFSNNKMVMQYRSQIMPLISLSEALADNRIETANIADAHRAQGETIQVIVHTKNGRSIGFLVDRIVDVIEESLVLQRTNIRPGVLGSAVLDKKVTDLIDVEGLIHAALPALSEDAAFQAA